MREEEEEEEVIGHLGVTRDVTAVTWSPSSADHSTVINRDYRDK